MSKDEPNTPPEDDAALISRPPALQGAATVTEHPVPVIANAVWEITEHPEHGTCAQATILGGTAIVHRKDNGHLYGRWVMKDGDEVKVDSSTPLTRCTTVAEAQIAYEVIIRESLSKTHPAIAAAGAVAEHEERLAQAPEDPF